MTRSVRIIGIGSPVEGDTVGMQLVEQLSKDSGWQDSGIEWHVLERPGAGLLHYLKDAELVCIVDALQSEHHSGVVRINAEDLLASDIALSSHHIGVAETLQLAAALKQLPQKLLIYGVVGDGDHYAELSAMLKSDLNELFKTPVTG